MANARGVSVTDSAVYKVVRTHRNNPTYHTGHKPNGMEGDQGSWSFLQRLLAIEEAHDRKKMTYVGLDQYCPADSDRNNNVNIDATSRWIRGQVLDDEEEPYDKAPPELRIGSCKLPPIGRDRPELREDLFKPRPLEEENTHPELLPLRSTSPSESLHFPKIEEDTKNTQRESPPFLRMASRTQDTSTQVDEDFGGGARHRRKRPLRLPPILLPRVYTINPRPLKYRQFLTPTTVRGPISESEWEDLKDCRYIRHASPRYSLHMSSSNISLNKIM